MARFGAIEQLDRYLNHHILAAGRPEDVHAWWTTKVRAKRVLEQSPDPPALAARILRILRQRTVTTRRVA